MPRDWRVLLLCQHQFLWRDETRSSMKRIRYLPLDAPVTMATFPFKLPPMLRRFDYTRNEYVTCIALSAYNIADRHGCSLAFKFRIHLTASMHAFRSLSTRAREKRLDFSIVPGPSSNSTGWQIPEEAALPAAYSRSLQQTGKVIE